MLCKITHCAGNSFLKPETTAALHTSNIHQLRKATCVIAISLQEWVTQHGEMEGNRIFILVCMVNKIARKL